MCGAAACAFSASALSHFSRTTKVSGPNGVWKPHALGVDRGAVLDAALLGVDRRHVRAELVQDGVAHAGLGGDHGDDVDHVGRSSAVGGAGRSRRSGPPRPVIGAEEGRLAATSRQSSTRAPATRASTIRVGQNGTPCGAGLSEPRRFLLRPIG